jgi:hypothetical protein
MHFVLSLYFYVLFFWAEFIPLVETQLQFSGREAATTVNLAAGRLHRYLFDAGSKKSTPPNLE